MYQLLIVEDEELLRNSLRTMVDWQAAGIRVAGAVENGLQALQFLSLSGHAVDIVLTDIRMPGMDGLELACALQGDYPHIKTVLYSAHNDFHLAQKGIEYGVCGYLLKSQDESEVAAYFGELAERMRQETGYRLDTPPKQRPDMWERRQGLLERLLQSPASLAGVDAEEMLRQAAACRVDLSAPPYCAVLMELDDCQAVDVPADAYRRQLEKLLAELILQAVEWTGMGYLLGWGGQCVLLCPCETVGRQELACLHTDLTRELNGADSALEITLTVACSGPVHTIGELPAAFEAAGWAMQSKFYRGGGKLLLSQPDPLVQSHIGEAEQERIILELASLCKAGFHDARMQYLTALSENWRRKKITDRKAVNEICRRVCHRAGKEKPALASLPLEKLFQCDTIDSLLHRFAALLEELLEEPPREAKKRPNKLVVEAVNYMREHYPLDINLEKVAAHVCVHPVHLSRLFRQEMAQTFKEQLTYMRMEQAKLLLASTHLRIYEIADRVGYRKPRYFSILFKEVTGMTPLEYRESS